MSLFPGLLLRDRSSERFYAMQDSNWNVSAVCNSGGAISERFASSAYGQPIFLSPDFAVLIASAYDWETLYAGYRWDSDLRWLNVRHRTLHPVLGSWIESDSLGVGPREPNLYQYVRSNPLIHVDPLGLFCMADPGKDKPKFKENPKGCDDVCEEARKKNLGEKNNPQTKKVTHAWAGVMCGPNGNPVCACVYDIAGEVVLDHDECDEINACLLDHEQGHIDAAHGSCDPNNPRVHRRTAKDRKTQDENTRYHKQQLANDLQCLKNAAAKSKGKCKRVAEQMIAILNREGGYVE